MMTKMRLREYAGQRCDVVLTKTDRDRVYVTFESDPRYGYPNVDLQQLDDLREKCRVLQDKM